MPCDTSQYCAGTNEGCFETIRKDENGETASTNCVCGLGFYGAACNIVNTPTSTSRDSATLSATSTATLTLINGTSGFVAIFDTGSVSSSTVLTAQENDYFWLPGIPSELEANGLTAVSSLVTLFPRNQTFAKAFQIQIGVQPSLLAQAQTSEAPHGSEVIIKHFDYEKQSWTGSIGTFDPTTRLVTGFASAFGDYKVFFRIKPAPPPEPEKDLSMLIGLLVAIGVVCIIAAAMFVYVWYIQKQRKLQGLEMQKKDEDDNAEDQEREKQDQETMSTITDITDVHEAGSTTSRLQATSHMTEASGSLQTYDASSTLRAGSAEFPAVEATVAPLDKFQRIINLQKEIQALRMLQQHNEAIMLQSEIETLDKSAQSIPIPLSLDVAVQQPTSLDFPEDVVKKSAAKEETAQNKSTDFVTAGVPFSVQDVSDKKHENTRLHAQV